MARQTWYRDGLVIRSTAKATQRLSYPPRPTPADVPIPTTSRSLDAHSDHVDHNCQQAECDDTWPSYHSFPNLMRGGQHRPALFRPADRPAHAGIWGVLLPLGIGGALGILVMLWATAPW